MQRVRVSEIASLVWSHPIIYVLSQKKIPVRELEYLGSLKVPIIFVSVVKRDKTDLLCMLEPKDYYCEKAGVNSASLVYHILRTVKRFSYAAVIGSDRSLVQLTHHVQTNVYPSLPKFIAGECLKRDYSLKYMEALLLEVIIKDILDKKYSPDDVKEKMERVVKYVTEISWFGRRAKPSNPDACRWFLEPYVNLIKEQYLESRVHPVSRVAFYRYLGLRGKV